jgi:pimeloyl-ACP methyl ester carboxylesterase
MTSRGPVILTITGAWADREMMTKLPQVVGPAWDAVLMRLPGNETPWLEETSIAAWGRAVRELVAATFTGRVVVLIGLSIGALVALAAAGSDVCRVIALEPPLSTIKLWPMLPGLRARLAEGTCEREEAVFIDAVFGVTESGNEDRRYEHLFEGVQAPVDVVLGDVPLMPPRKLARFPSFVDAPERAWLEAQPGVTVHVASGAGHAVQIAAGEFVRDVLIGALGLALEDR